MNLKMKEPYYAVCDVSKEKMTKGQYNQLRYCESKMKMARCSCCLFSQRLQTLG